MKKFLIISYAFPPTNVVGALRPYRLCRYLPQYGWEPTVLTSRPNTVQRFSNIGKDLGSLQSDICYVPTFDLIGSLLKAVKLLKPARPDKDARNSSVGRKIDQPNAKSHFHSNAKTQ